MKRCLGLLVLLVTTSVAAEPKSTTDSTPAAVEAAIEHADMPTDTAASVDVTSKPDVTATDTAPPKSHDPTALGRKLRIPLVAIGHVLMLAPPLIYYWNSVEDQKEDWEMRWDWETWKHKLTNPGPLVIDTNRFEANGMRHPLAGALTYQIGRANGFGVLGSTVMNFGASWVWEYIGEFKERPALNDLVTNTASGILIGEPLFQIGRLGEGEGGLARRSLALVASPFSSTQRELKLSPLVPEPRPAHRIEAFAGTNLVRHQGERATGEVRLGLDLELMRDRGFARPGTEVTASGMAAWSRVAFDLRLADQGTVPGIRFRSTTSYIGRYARDFDAAGDGSATFVGVGGGFELHQRRLLAEIDRYSVLSLIGPRAAGWLRSPRGELDWEVAATGDLAMVQAHAFALQPLMENSSVLRTRGYYYAPAVSGTARVRARHGRWNAELEGTVHQFWSYDEHSYGGDDDPKDVQDQRAVSTATIGVRPTASDIRLELFGDATLRRGAWTTIQRHSTELTTGVALTAGF